MCPSLPYFCSPRSLGTNGSLYVNVMGEASRYVYEPKTRKPPRIQGEEVRYAQNYKCHGIWSSSRNYSSLRTYRHRLLTLLERFPETHENFVRNTRQNSVRLLRVHILPPVGLRDWIAFVLVHRPIAHSVLLWCFPYTSTATADNQIAWPVIRVALHSFDHAVMYLSVKRYISSLTHGQGPGFKKHVSDSPEISAKNKFCHIPADCLPAPIGL